MPIKHVAACSYFETKDYTAPSRSTRCAASRATLMAPLRWKTCKGLSERCRSFPRHRIVAVAAPPQPAIALDLPGPARLGCRVASIADAARDLWPARPLLAAVALGLPLRKHPDREFTRAIDFTVAMDDPQVPPLRPSRRAPRPVPPFFPLPHEPLPGAPPRGARLGSEGHERGCSSRECSITGRDGRRDGGRRLEGAIRVAATRRGYPPDFKAMSDPGVTLTQLFDDPGALHQPRKSGPPKAP